MVEVVERRKKERERYEAFIEHAWLFAHVHLTGPHRDSRTYTCLIRLSELGTTTWQTRWDEVDQNDNQNPRRAL